MKGSKTHLNPHDIKHCNEKENAKAKAKKTNCSISTKNVSLTAK